MNQAAINEKLENAIAALEDAQHLYGVHSTQDRFSLDDATLDAIDTIDRARDGIEGLIRKSQAHEDREPIVTLTLDEFENAVSEQAERYGRGELPIPQTR